MEALPADTIEDILVRLAVKSLLRFKCVCRSWCALIQSRRFIHRHYCRDSNQDRVVFRTGEYVENQLEEGYRDRLLLPYLGENVSYHLGAVNGVLCEVSTSGNIVLLNPATHKVKRVPPPLPFGRRFPVYELTLGFGLDPLSGDYKILAIVDGAGEFVWVYNSSSDCWKRVEVVGSCSVIKGVWYTRLLDAAFSNGIYYWVVEGDQEDCGGILALDMMSEMFREIKFPEFKVQHGGSVAIIAAYGDSIALMWRRNGNGNECEVWVMGRQGIWSKSWALSLCYWMWPLCLWKNKVFFLNDQDRAYTLVDVSTGEAKRVEVELPNHPMKYPPFVYKESLFWINE